MAKNTLENFIGLRRHSLTFNRILEVKRYRIPSGGIVDRIYIECKCDCGSFTETEIATFKRGHRISCGCRNGEKIRTHGMRYSPFYAVYHAMINRCNSKNDKSYKNYGDRGIRCLWKSFEEFKKDMYGSYERHSKAHGGRQTTLDRIDNNSDYSKENCKWVTQIEQGNNKRNNVRLVYKGKDKTVSQWARIIGVSPSTLRERLEVSKDIDQIMAPKGQFDRHVV